MNDEPSPLAWAVIALAALSSPFAVIGVRDLIGLDLMGWCVDLLLDEKQRRYDPFGYGFGLGFIYIILPVIIGAFFAYLTWGVRQAFKENH